MLGRTIFDYSLTMERLPGYSGSSPEQQLPEVAAIAERHFNSLVYGGLLTLKPPYLRTQLTYPGVGEVVYVDGQPGSQHLTGYTVSAVFEPYGHPALDTEFDSGEIDLEVINRGIWLIEQSVFVPVDASDTHERRIAPLGLPKGRTFAHYDAASNLWHVIRGKKHETTLKPNELTAVTAVAQQTAFVMDLAALVVSRRGHRLQPLKLEAGEDFWTLAEVSFEDNNTVQYVIGEMHSKDIGMTAVKAASTFEHLFIEVESSMVKDELPYGELMQALRARQAGPRMATALNELTYNDGQWERLRKKLPLLPQKDDTPIIGVFPGVLEKRHLQKLMGAAIDLRFNRLPAYASTTEIID